MTITKPSVPAAAFPPPPVADDVRADRARVPLTPPTGLINRAMMFYSKRRFGKVADSLLAMSHNRRVLITDARFEMSLARWNRLDPQLRFLAQGVTAARIECTWCMDFGYFLAHSEGLDMAKISALPTWRTSDVYTDLERRVLEYSEAVTATPPQVTDEMTEALRKDLGDDGLVELTMMVCVENIRSRFNASLGLASQGFSESCRVPTQQ